MIRIGSLFSGAGGLDLAVEEVFGGETIWQSEIDKAASKVLAYRWPGVPNLGSITEIDWASVEPVDVLCGGFPCQDVSAAGKRAGIKAGTRSGLWSVFADAIDALRPQLVVIENVRGLLSATAHRTVDDADGDVESGAGAVGDGAGRPVLRAAGAVLGDLADLGYDAQWATVAAADVGAPHRRERVFILATADTASVGWVGRQNIASGCEEGEWAQREPVGSIDQSPHSSRNGRDEGRPESAGFVGDVAVSGDEPGVALLPTPNADVSRGVRSPDGIAKRIAKGDKQFSLEDAVALLPTPTTQDGANNGGPSQFDRNTLPLNAVAALLPTHAASDCTGGGSHPDSRVGHSRQLIDYALLSTPQARDWKNESGSNYQTLPRDLKEKAWGKYLPAIARWEAIVGPAPAPTEPNKNGNPRLSALFSEWLMGWPAGWVTDPAIGISRNDQLRIVGNGVCPQQAAAALRYLLNLEVAA